MLISLIPVKCLHAGSDELELGTGVQTLDALVHFAAVPRILIKLDNETFRVNTMGSYNVIEAAVKLGIKKIIIESSKTTYGVFFRDSSPNQFYSFTSPQPHSSSPAPSFPISPIPNFSQ